MSDEELVERVGRMIEAHGLAAVEAEMTAVAELARGRGADLLADVLGDPREPAVVRERALGRLALSLHRRPALAPAAPVAPVAAVSAVAPALALG